MKINYNYIKGFLLLALVFFLFSFAGKRNSKRNVEKVEISFTNTENLYISELAVNKLLIQNFSEVQSIGKETLALNKLEARLNAHDMIENAEVFLSIDGKLGASITQRKPIARVLGREVYYIDRQGLKMPLSKYYSARVPLVTGISEENLDELFPLLDYIRKDEFLSRQIVGVERKKEGVYELQIRELDLVAYFGKINKLDKKFNNFKAFYKQALKEEKLNTYKKVDLQFGNQVVATKK